MSTKVTLTRALASLSHTQDKIERAIREGSFFAVSQGTQGTPFRRSEKTLVELQATIDSAYKSVLDLIKYKEKLAGVIAKTNAVTIVKVAGVEYTIAEAIAAKNSIKNSRALLDHMKSQYLAANRVKEELNTGLEKSIQATMDNVYGKAADANKLPVDARTVIAKPLLDRHEASLVTPNQETASALIRKMEDEIEAFENEVDFCLSEVNARTEVEI